jgi:glutamate-5-semialdehyde dehydrogenase
MSLHQELESLAAGARLASRALARLTSDEKNTALRSMADAFEQQLAGIKTANDRDLEAARATGMTGAMLERLKLDEKRIMAMARGVREVANLPDPIGKVLDERVRPNGLRLQKISTPIGVVMIIYESRPNVTADAASLCFKSGNACILRGGKEAIHSNTLIADLMLRAGRNAVPHFPEGAIQLVKTTDRDAIKILLSMTSFIDVCMPRGGEGLIRAVSECSKVPVIKHYKGVCHVYVDKQSSAEMAEEIALNAKVQRPAVCNAMETLLIHREIAPAFLPRIAKAMMEKNVELRLDSAALRLLNERAQPSKVRAATEADWSTEYNDYILNIGIVDDVGAAINHINKFGSAHSDSIVTTDAGAASRFLAEVDSAAVYWNASTRFTDGYEFGMGAEIGISTDKIGARGPMGLEELTSYKWLGFGTGQLRQ